MLELIEHKAEGEEIAIQPAARSRTKVPDLMAALEASLAAAQKTGRRQLAQRRKRAANGDGGGAGRRSRPGAARSAKAAKKS